MRHSRLKRFRYTLIQPGGQPIGCHTMNGNCVLEPQIAHAMGDTDYGLRAGRTGIKVFIAPNYVGQCQRSQVTGSFNERTLYAKQRWEKIMQPKGLSPASWWMFTWRHDGMLAPIYWVWA